MLARTKSQRKVLICWRNRGRIRSRGKAVTRLLVGKRELMRLPVRTYAGQHLFILILSRRPISCAGQRNNQRFWKTPESRLLEINTLCATMGAAFPPDATRRRVCSWRSPGRMTAHASSNRRGSLASERRAWSTRDPDQRRRAVGRRYLAHAGCSSAHGLDRHLHHDHSASHHQ